jgi:hypothetical protein
VIYGKANENRAVSKNELDEHFKELIEKKDKKS